MKNTAYNRDFWRDFDSYKKKSGPSKAKIISSFIVLASSLCLVAYL